jgi:hypothetical protein
MTTAKYLVAILIVLGGANNFPCGLALPNSVFMCIFRPFQSKFSYQK